MSSLRFAIIDDDPDSRVIMQDLLAASAWIDLYEDGETALAGMRGRVPDLVMVDISLPDCNGIEFLHRMRGEALLAEVPALAVTAHAMAGDRERLLAAGFQGYLAKPVDEESLHSLIRETLADLRSAR